MASNYHAFTQQLVTALSANPAILGLVALGSMAERRHLPDSFSDHDFFVITENAEAMRSTTAWLPQPEQLAFWFRETPHGCKAIYDDGHLVEYAVFTPDELQLARVNDYRVLLDRERIEERISHLAQRIDAAPDVTWLRGSFLGNLLVAIQRAQRGELLSARWMLTHAMRHLVALIGGGDDNLDPLRRVPRPDIEEAMQQDVVDAARALLAIFEKEANGDPRAISALRASFPSARG